LLKRKILEILDAALLLAILDQLQEKLVIEEVCGVTSGRLDQSVHTS
jgi:hypothetical protein